MPHLVHGPLASSGSGGAKILLRVERSTLAKRRWQAEAEDGRAFGFDLESHLHDGDVIFENETARYVLAQQPEAVLQIALGAPVDTARHAWSLGNLHFPIEVRPDGIRVQDDPAVRLFLNREHIHFDVVRDIFHPRQAVASGHAHGHAHPH